MCTKLFIPIKAVNSAGVRCGWVPCGKCEDCRNAMRSSWVFRLRVELDKLCEKGWKIGFFTLTYSNESLPTIPKYLFKSEFREIPCFSKSDIRTFFTKLKKFCWRHYDCRGESALRYMLCSEYGEHTQRPHYHGIICFPPNIPDKVMFEKIHELWIDKGFVFPRELSGGYDSHGYLHKSFVCSSVKAASVYAAKYCCKDLAWYDTIRQDEFYKKVTVYFDEFGETEFCYVNDNEKDYSNPILFRPVLSHESSYSFEYKLTDYKPFHYQSKSLGKSFLDNLSDSDKLRYLNDGYCFLGDSVFQSLPVYLRNKIIFNPKYIVDERGKRLVRREATSFFCENLEQIFDMKVRAIASKFDEFQNPQFWDSVGAPRDKFKEIFREIPEFFTTPSTELAKLYVAYYGVPSSESLDISPAVQWFRRYCPECVDVNCCFRLPSETCQSLNYMFSYIFNAYSVFDWQMSRIKQWNQRQIDRIHDMWKSME